MDLLDSVKEDPLFKVPGSGCPSDLPMGKRSPLGSVTGMSTGLQLGELKTPDVKVLAPLCTACCDRGWVGKEMPNAFCHW